MNIFKKVMQAAQAIEKMTDPLYDVMDVKKNKLAQKEEKAMMEEKQGGKRAQNDETQSNETQNGGKVQSGDVAKEDIDAVLNMLENFGRSEESRLKVVMSDEMEQGKSQKQYHLGRCDVGSPWAKGQAFDVLPDEAQKGNNCG